MVDVNSSGEELRKLVANAVAEELEGVKLNLQNLSASHSQVSQTLERHHSDLIRRLDALSRPPRPCASPALLNSTGVPAGDRVKKAGPKKMKEVDSERSLNSLSDRLNSLNEDSSDSSAGSAPAEYGSRGADPNILVTEVDDITHDLTWQAKHSGRSDNHHKGQQRIAGDSLGPLPGAVEGVHTMEGEKRASKSQRHRLLDNSWAEMDSLSVTPSQGRSVRQSCASKMSGSHPVCQSPFHFGSHGGSFRSMGKLDIWHLDILHTDRMMEQELKFTGSSSPTSSPRPSGTHSTLGAKSKMGSAPPSNRSSMLRSNRTSIEDGHLSSRASMDQLHGVTSGRNSAASNGTRGGSMPTTCLPPGSIFREASGESDWAASSSPSFNAAAGSPRSNQSGSNGKMKSGRGELMQSGRGLDLDNLRTMHESDLIFQGEKSNISQESEQGLQGVHPMVWLGQHALAVPNMLFVVCGIVPFDRENIWRWYRFVVLAVLLCLTVTPMYFEGEATFFYIRMSESCCALGCVVALTFLQWHQESVGRLVGSGKHLETCARRSGFYNEWVTRSFEKFMIVLVFWGSTVALWLFWTLFPGISCSGRSAQADNSGAVFLASLSPIFASGFIALLMYFQVHLCCNLELMVDCFCWNFFVNVDFRSGVNEWNNIQAMLRRAADTIDSSFLATQTSILVGSLLMVAELLIGDEEVGCVVAWSSTILPILCLALYCLFQAAAVSEKCSRVPALMNSLRIDGSPCHLERQYLVQYIEHSAAGFYVKGVRLTAFIALKMSYMAGVLIFMFLTRAGVDDSSGVENTA